MNITVTAHMALRPTTPLSCSKMISCRQVVGANLDQIGMKPFQKPSGPSFLNILTAQSPKPLYSLTSDGWFISLVLMMSNGETVMVMKKPAENADMNCRGIPSGANGFINYLQVS
jgi:hypothetical protein